MEYLKCLVAIVLIFQAYQIHGSEVANNSLDQNNQHLHDSNASFLNKQHEHKPQDSVIQVLVEQIQKIPQKLGLEPEKDVHAHDPNPEIILAKETSAAELEKLKKEKSRSIPDSEVYDPEIETDEHKKITHPPHEEDEKDRNARALGLDFGTKDKFDNSLFQSPRLCGYSPRANPSRLSNASPGQFPWTAAILSEDNRFLCSGTLISESIVLTTATCILMYQKTNQPLKIKLGAWSLPDGYEYLPELNVDVRAAVLHPLYDQSASVHDIGLLRLVGNVDFDLNPHIFPVCVIGPNFEATTSISKCLVTGWPDLPEMEPWRSRAFLTWGPVSVSRSSCPANTPNSCANGQACVANRGSPLICLANSQRYYVWGIVPQDMNCNRGSSVANVPITSVIDNYDFIQRYLYTPNPNTLN